MVRTDIRDLVQLPERPLSREEALEGCRSLARTHGENFTVISWLTPRSMRDHLAVLYAFCRTVDDIGDEALDPEAYGRTTTSDRLALLDRFERQLDAAFAGHARHPVLVALQETIERFDLPRDPFARLIEANRIDQRKTRHASFAEILHYCEHSANPVGQLFLMLYGHRDEGLFALSDATCTALQLTNFWQDIRRDADSGRIYLPQDDMARFGVAEADLVAPAASPALRDLMRFEVDRARRLFAAGLPLIDRVGGHLRVDLALFTRGGLAILDKIEEQDYDTVFRRPTLDRREKASLFLSTLISQRWRRRV